MKTIKLTKAQAVRLKLSSTVKHNRFVHAKSTMYRATGTAITIRPNLLKDK